MPLKSVIDRSLHSCAILYPLLRFHVRFRFSGEATRPDAFERKSQLRLQKGETGKLRPSFRDYDDSMGNPQIE